MAVISRLYFRNFGNSGSVENMRILDSKKQRFADYNDRTADDAVYFFCGWLSQ